MSNELLSLEEPILKGPHARRRFVQHLFRFEKYLGEALDQASVNLPGQVLFQRNGRTPMFMLEALGRVYEKLDLYDELFSLIRLETKIIEDALGQIDFWDVIEKKCKDWSMPDGVQKLARERYVETCGRVWAWVESQDWVATRYHPEAELLVPRFTRKLKKVDWHSPKKESRQLRKWLAKELRTIHEKTLQLDMRQIESGLHKARREVRWVSIYFTAVDGGFVLDHQAAPPDKWDRYLTREIVENPYNRLPEPEADDDPVRIPAYLLFALSYAIDKLGVIKDRAQWTETFKHLLQITGEKVSLPSLMKENHLEDGDATEQGTRVIQQVLINDQVLLRLADAIKAT